MSFDHGVSGSSNMSPHHANNWATKDGQYNYERIIDATSSYGITLQAKRGKFGPRVAILLFNLPWAGTIRETKLKKFAGLDHKNITYIHECYDCYDPPLSTMLLTQFPRLPPPTAVAVVMELSLTGTLSTYLANYHVSEETRLRWYKDLARGLQYLHLKGILHYDMCPKNIWIQDDQLKIANMGFAQVARESSKKFNMNFGEFLKEYMSSSVPFVAPESLNGMYNCLSEVFSLAMVFLAIAESPDQGHHSAKWGDKTDHLGPLLHSHSPPRSLKPIHLLDPPVISARPQETNLFNAMLDYDCYSRPDISTVLDTLQGMKLGGKETVMEIAYKWLCSC